MRIKKPNMLLCIFAFCFSQTLMAQFSGNGSGTADDPYQITNEDDLFDVRNNLSANYILMNDLDLTDWIAEESPKQGWDPISSFTGKFNGNNKIIKGLMINRPNLSNVGLFGSTSGATIMNLCLEKPIVKGKENVGALIGSASNTNIWSIQLLSPDVNGSSNNVGSIAGKVTVNGSVSSSESSLTIISPKIKGKNAVGGFFGYRSDANQLPISGGSITNPIIEGSNYVGGVVGDVVNCGIQFHQIKNPIIKGSNCIGGLIGRCQLKGPEKTLNPNTVGVSSNIILGGTIEGSLYVGGAIGAITTVEHTKEPEVYITGNYASANLLGDYAGGICGYSPSYYYSSTNSYLNVTQLLQL